MKKFNRGSGNDNIVGNALANLIRGEAGNDRLSGEGGDDTLKGNGGNDSLFGGDDDDLLQGAFGNDSIEGGAGSPKGLASRPIAYLVMRVATYSEVVLETISSQVAGDSAKIPSKVKGEMIR